GHQRGQVVAPDLLGAQLRARRAEGGLGVLRRLREARAEIVQRLALAFVRGLEVGLELAERRVDLVARRARGLLHAALEVVAGVAAVAALLAYLARELLAGVVEAFFQRGEPLLHLAAQARGLLLEPLLQLDEAALVVAHLPAEQDVADLVDVAVAGTVGL